MSEKPVEYVPTPKSEWDAICRRAQRNGCVVSYEPEKSPPFMVVAAKRYKAWLAALTSNKSSRAK